MRNHTDHVAEVRHRSPEVVARVIKERTERRWEGHRENRRCGVLPAPSDVANALNDVDTLLDLLAEVRADERARALDELHPTSSVSWSIVHGEGEDRAHSMGGPDPYRLQRTMQEHPEWFPADARIERCTTRWLTTEGESTWELWQPVDGERA